MPPPPVADDDASREIRISLRAQKKVPMAVILRCVRVALQRRVKRPVNDSWQEPPVIDIDQQRVIMVIRRLDDEEGRRLLLVESAHYQTKKEW